jgi:hypothetical protein
MQEQVEATNRLYTEAQKQTPQFIRQAGATGDLAEATQAGNRPYVGTLTVTPPTFDESKHTFTFTVVPHNFGPIPAEHVSIKVTPMINQGGEAHFKNNFPIAPATLFPTQSGGLDFEVDDSNWYRELRSGYNSITLCITYTYDARKGHEQYHQYQSFRYIGMNGPGWRDLGECMPFYR